MFTLNLRRTMASVLLLVGTLFCVSVRAQEARIGSLFYNTVQDAINAAQVNHTVTLITSLDDLQQTIYINKAITLDLNQHAVTAASTVQNILEISANATIKNGSLIQTNTSGTCVYIGSNKAENVVLQSVKCIYGYYGVRTTVGKSLQLTNCTLSNKTTALRASGNVRIENSTISSPIDINKCMLTMSGSSMTNLKLSASDPSTVRLTKVDIKATQPITLAGSNKLTMVAGRFKNESGAGFVLSGSAEFTTAKSSDGYSTSINTRDNAISAIDNARLTLEGGTILANEQGGILLGGKAMAALTNCNVQTNAQDNIAFELKDSSHADFEGGTIANLYQSTSNAGNGLVASTTATITTHGTTFMTESNGYAIKLMKPASTLDGVIAKAPNGTALLMANCSGVTVTNCQLSGKRALYCMGTATLGDGNDFGSTQSTLITSGTLTVKGGYYQNASGNICEVDGSGKFLIYGGHFKGSSFIDTNTASSACTLFGGIYTDNPNYKYRDSSVGVNTIGANFPDYADGYRYYLSKEKPWSVSGVNYSTLEEAVAQAKVGDYIGLLNDVFITDSNIDIDKRVNLLLSGNTINMYRARLKFSAGSCWIQNGSILQNTNDGNAPAIYLTGDFITMKDLTLKSNKTAFMSVAGGCTIDNCHLEGGANPVSIVGNGVIFKNSTFVGNARCVYVKAPNIFESDGCTYQGLGGASTPSDAIIYIDTKEIHFDNSKIEGTDDAYMYGLWVIGPEYGFIRETNLQGSFSTAALCNDASNIYLQECAIKNTAADAPTIENKNSGELEISSGDYQSKSTLIKSLSGSIEIRDGKFMTSGALFAFGAETQGTIKNGGFLSNKLMLGAFGFTPDLTITGGRYNIDPVKFLAEGLKVTKLKVTFNQLYKYEVTNVDVNGDGSISVGDITHSIEFFNHRIPKLRTASRMAADLNGDGEVDDNDISLLSRKVLNLVDSTLYFGDYEYVDLGVKDSEGRTIYWAKQNVGAESIEDAGKYYSWGDLQGWRVPSYVAYYDFENNYQDPNPDGNELDLEYDAVRQQMGGTWRMPTASEVQQIVSNCDFADYTVNGIKGVKISNKQRADQWIFIPAGGYAFDTEEAKYSGELALIWTSSIDGNYADNSSTFAYLLGKTPSVGYRDRYLGLPLRGVCVVDPNALPEVEEEEAEAETHEFVDLGVVDRDGRKYLWAKTNIGAINEYDDGAYFAWGETVGHMPSENYQFSWANYKFGNGTSDWKYITKYTKPDGEEGNWYTMVDGVRTFVGDNKTELEPEDDAATVLWGDDWRTPNFVAMLFLTSQCDLEVIEAADDNGFGGRAGYKVSNPNDPSKYIFLPCLEGYYDNVSGGGQYWMSTLYDDGNQYAMYYQVIESQKYIYLENHTGRSRGLAIRPVKVIEPTVPED